MLRVTPCKKSLKTEINGEQLIVKVWIKGKIREIVSSHIDFDFHILRNGTDDKFDDDTFYGGDDLFLSFMSPFTSLPPIDMKSILDLPFSFFTKVEFD